MSMPDAQSHSQGESGTDTNNVDSTTATAPPAVANDDNDDNDKDENVKIKIAEVDPDNNPIVISFPGGLPESVHNEAVQPPKFVWQKLNARSKFGRRVVGHDRYCVYSAHARGLAFDDRRTKVCVGVYNRKRKTVVLYLAATRGTVYAMQQSVPTYIEERRNVGANPGSPGLRPSVFEDFGSVKKRKVLKSQSANRVDVDNVIGAGSGSAVVSQIMKGHDMSESNKKAIEESKQSDSDRKTAAELAVEAARRQLLPAFDENAVKPEKVYDAKAIAGDNAWTGIHNKVYACLHQEDPVDAIVQSVFENDWAEFVLKSVNGVDPEATNAAFRLTCLILVNWMVKFYMHNHRRKSIEGINETKAAYFGIPTDVAKRCFELFTIPVSTTTTKAKSKETYIMSKHNREKIIVHILLLYMIAQGPSMKIPDLKPIAECMKVSVNDCVTFLRYAGCTVTKKGTTISATLKTPLEFPAMSRGGPRASRGR